MEKPLTTTTIGAFPKPTYTPIGDWFDISRKTGGMNSAEPTKNYQTDLSKNKDKNEELFVRAAKEVIEIQIRAGIDIPTDGEVRRENYIHYHCRHLAGFDFENLEHRILRDGAYETDLPAVRSKIEHKEQVYSVKDFKAAQALSSRPIKFTLPGPLTMMDTTADCFYDDRPRLNRILADTINKEILALVESGCKHIQVDEPLFARQVNDALSFGFEGIDRCFHKVPKSVSRIVHMCCGYPDHLDDLDYKKANPESYNDLSAMINEADFDQISIEDKHCCNNLELLEKLPNKSVIFGSIAIASSRTETLDEVVSRLKLALDHIDRERLIVAPDCGLGLLPPDLAEEKLRVMCQAAAIV